MRITKIEIKNYRGFPSDIDFNLGTEGKNLILYGENGSGKSSLYHALRNFFSLLPPNIKEQKNIFKEDDEPSIKLSIGDTKNPSVIYEWSEQASPKDQAIIQGTAKTKGFIDYKDILETSYVHRFDKQVNLFNLLIRHILANVNNPITKVELGEEWAQILVSLNGRQTANIVEKRNQMITGFNDGVLETLKNLQQRANDVLSYFDPNIKINLVFKPVPVPLPKSTRASTYQIYEEIILEIEYFGIKVNSPHIFLNEARLTAIGLSLYLSSFLQYPKSSLQLLVLDDALIGLDLSNRIPLLEVLEKLFTDWQILLLTYDKVWFEIVRSQKPDWCWQELYINDSLIPVIKNNCDYLKIAKDHLNNHDEHAAAVYIRAEFERKLKKYCEKQHVRVQYKEPPQKTDTGEMLDELEKVLKADPKWTSDATWQAQYPKMFLSVRTARKVVLNPLSHSELVTLAKAEIQQAIDAIENFMLL
jgi:hypothetical protein